MAGSPAPDMGISCNEQFHPCTTGTSLGLQLRSSTVYDIWPHFAHPQDHSLNILIFLLPVITLVKYLPFQSFRLFPFLFIPVIIPVMPFLCAVHPLFLFYLSLLFSAEVL